MKDKVCYVVQCIKKQVMLCSFQAKLTTHVAKPIKMFKTEFYFKQKDTFNNFDFSPYCFLLI